VITTMWKVIANDSVERKIFREHYAQYRKHGIRRRRSAIAAMQITHELRRKSAYANG
jgi:hypothetical protein